MTTKMISISQKELDGLRKKAARYDWLRSRMEGEDSIAGNIAVAWSDVLQIHSSKVKRWPDAVDKAIDEAMAREVLSSLEVIGKGEKG